MNSIFVAMLIETILNIAVLPHCQLMSTILFSIVTSDLSQCCAFAWFNILDNCVYNVGSKALLNPVILQARNFCCVNGERNHRCYYIILIRHSYTRNILKIKDFCAPAILLQTNARFEFIFISLVMMV